MMLLLLQGEEELRVPDESVEDILTRGYGLHPQVVATLCLRLRGIAKLCAGQEVCLLWHTACLPCHVLVCACLLGVLTTMIQQLSRSTYCK